MAVFRGALLEAPLVGLPTAQKLQEFIARVAAAAPAGAGASKGQEYKEHMAMAMEALSKVATSPAMAQMATQAFGAALEVAVGLQEQHAAIAGLALLSISLGDEAGARDLVARIKGQEWRNGALPLTRRAVAVLELQDVLEEARKKPLAEGGNKEMDTMFREAIEKAGEGNLQEAVDILLEMLKKDKNQSNAKELIQRIFAADGTIAGEGRKRLAKILFV